LLGSQTGKSLYTSTHRLLCDRGRIIITRRDAAEPVDSSFSSIDEMRMSGLFAELHIKDPSGDALPVSPLTACLDLDRVSFPIRVRHWEPGDRFFPLGMKQKKKVSDFLTDMKIPVTEKERVLLLLSDDEVMWVMGYRIDDRFRVTDQSGKILMLTL